MTAPTAAPTSTHPWAGCVYVGGAFTAAARTAPTVEKATGRPLAETGVATPAEVDAAVAAARDAKRAWAALVPPERAAAVLRLRAVLERRREEVVDWIRRETGGIRLKAEHEVRLALAHLADAAALATRPATHQASSVVPGRRNLVQRVPVGVVGLITPWNLPLALAVSPLAPAIALGNTVVLKPAPHTPVSGGLLIADLAHEAGLPPGVLGVVPGDDATGAALVAHPDLDMLRFTGSTEVGRAIAADLGRRLVRVSLELGGNAALVVLDDADPQVASMVGAWSSFQFAGQTCITAGRHIVARAIADDYVAALAARAARMVLGNPLDDVDLGPMIDERQVARVQALVRDSVALGARVVEGGTHDGLFHRPTVMVDVTADMPVFREEVFGPVAPVVVVDSEEEALELTNRTSFGLSNAVLTGDPWRGLRFAERVESGMVHVNDTTCMAESTVPFGGWKASSLGVPTGGDANLEQFTERRWISVQDAPLTYRY